MTIALRKYGWVVALGVTVALVAPLLGWGLGMMASSAPSLPHDPPEGFVLGALFLLLAGGAIVADRWGRRRNPWLWLSYLLILLLIGLVGWWLLRSPNAFGPHDPFPIRY
jgi:hypothetical protein